MRARGLARGGSPAAPANTPTRLECASTNARTAPSNLASSRSATRSDPFLAARRSQLCILIGNVCRNTNLCTREAPAFQRAFATNLQMARQCRPHLPLLQRANVRRQFFGQHRYDSIGEINAVAARLGLAVELGAGPHVETDVGNRDDCVPSAVAVRLGPDRVIMIARVGRIDGDDRQMRQVFPVPQRLRRNSMCLVDRLLAKLMRSPSLWNRDQAEAPWPNGRRARIDPRVTRGPRPEISHSTRSPASASSTR